MVKVTVVGASGYLGGELLRVLVNHPKVNEIDAVSRTHAGKAVSTIHSNLAGVFDEKFMDFKADKIGSDVVFFASPPGEWLKKVPMLLDKGMKVITLGGKFRINDAELDERTYPGHKNKKLLEERVYGLPEAYRKEIKNARFVTNPGCYPTSVILSMMPLAKLDGDVELDKVVINSVSGSSGAGAEPSKFLHHPEVSGNLRPYKLFVHRHKPEMDFVLGDVFNATVNALFTPSVGDFARGILSYVTVFSAGINENLTKHYREFYAKEPFVRIIDQDIENVPNLKDVVGTNFCDVGVNFNSDRIIILSAIDNLLKGGSGQAVQNMNLMLGFDEKAGLNLVGGRP
ncbi:MAG: N-acetyl-gamma-glutamyl-phosphate reductase [Candidatus Altiarchaeales archaeon]|nr:N-acetyl-gamma-glutamyl-phosphate reductase [Candidatus Altiarchaeota archaeon]MCG2782197.1 N-acetyl-gamma-glutamyl-phosphate reductase [Candidatus Altiarchaeales archaeon]MBU4266318.1 N-acetyl-gamma-glutamyl-phosphate reductase [Candidatus Altiarchaeota archaeon]MBU4341762.1 N-acetyl-gamma-glutamyl-phosphate reductase [Candidatus Altiarchaeota archaeon]MBU4406666.1 N-acetyl-gamma-glutamyl-phosphate reductase [Candidatus Altiarchaeota archaeon]